MTLYQAPGADLPTFRYFAAPYAFDLAFSKSEAACEICGERPGWIYGNFIYPNGESTREMIQPALCPNCIATGRAAAQLGCTFQIPCFEEGGSIESMEQVLKHTPGNYYYLHFLPVRWPVHCGECCAFLDELYGDLKITREMVLSNCLPEDVLLIEEAEQSYFGVIHVFRCLHCSVYRAAIEYQG